MASVVPDVCITVQAMKKGYVIAYTSTKEAIGYTFNCAKLTCNIHSTRQRDLLSAVCTY